MTDKQPHVNETPDSVAIGKEDVNNTQSDVSQGDTRSADQDDLLAFVKDPGTTKQAVEGSMDKRLDKIKNSGGNVSKPEGDDSIVAALQTIDIVDNLIHSITRRHIPDYPEATIAINKIDALIAQRIAEAENHVINKAHSPCECGSKKHFATPVRSVTGIVTTYCQFSRMEPSNSEATKGKI
jgi:hypothetical protein